jgi:hypothetical protein
MFRYVLQNNMKPHTEIFWPLIMLTERADIYSFLYEKGRSLSVFLQ